MTDRELVALMAAIVDAGSRASGFREDALTPQQSVERALELLDEARSAIDTQVNAGLRHPF